MNLNSISSLNFNKNIAFKSQKQSNSHTPNILRSGDFKAATYPKSYYLNQISFGKQLRANELIDRIGEENFPSPKIAERLRECGISRDYSLYNIHKEHYKGLLDCETLDEAKERYPEFSNVINAEDVNIELLPHNHKFYLIAKDKNRNIDFKTLSLNLLKKYYAELADADDKERYFNISEHHTLYKIFDLLNIKKMNIKYRRTVVAAQAEFRDKMTKIVQKHWDNEDGTRREETRKRASVVLNTVESRQKNASAMGTDDHKKIISARQKNAWAQDDGTRRQNASLWASINLHTLEVNNNRKAKMSTKEYKENISKSLREFNQNNPKYKEAQKLAWRRHPEITQKMSEIAKDYGITAEILEKKVQGRLSDEEDKRFKSYYKACERAMPGYTKITGQEYRNILIEWGLKEE